MTAYADIELAVQALRRGAFDFVTKPWDNVRLIATCREALERSALQGARPDPDAGEGKANRGGQGDSAGSGLAPTSEPLRSLAAQERAAVLAAMAQAEGNLSAAARLLGLSRAALYRRLDKHGL
jgi:DNA-binding NtrC family response regulator